MTLIDLDPLLIPYTALPDRVYDVLKRRILTCVMEPSKKLNERFLSAELGVSRTPLREALNRLAAEGLVDLIPYKGYVVSPLTVEQIRNLSELRRVVESEAAAMAAVRSTVADQKRLLALAELRYTPGNRKTYEKYLQANTAFHFAVARCSRNPSLEQVVISVLGQLQRPLYLGLDVGVNARQATAEHLELVKAIRAKSAARARKVMAEQLMRAEKRVTAALTKMQTSTSSDAKQMLWLGRRSKGML